LGKLVFLLVAGFIEVNVLTQRNLSRYKLYIASGFAAVNRVMAKLQLSSGKHALPVFKVFADFLTRIVFGKIFLIVHLVAFAVNDFSNARIYTKQPVALFVKVKAVCPINSFSC
jgi:hypothetical protein